MKEEVGEFYGDPHKLVLALIQACTDMLDRKWSELSRSPLEIHTDFADPSEVRVEFVGHEEGVYLVATVDLACEDDPPGFLVKIEHPGSRRGSISWRFTCTKSNGQYAALLEGHQVMHGKAVARIRKPQAA